MFDGADEIFGIVFLLSVYAHNEAFHLFPFLRNHGSTRIPIACLHCAGNLARPA
jgi:hypothetical protein